MKIGSIPTKPDLSQSLVADRTGNLPLYTPLLLFLIGVMGLWQVPEKSKHLMEYASAGCVYG